MHLYLATSVHYKYPTSSWHLTPKKKKKKLIMYTLTSSHLPVALIFAFCVCFKVAYSNDSVIQRVCAKTSFANECKTMIARSRCVSATDIYELAYALINISQTIVRDDIIRTRAIYLRKSQSFVQTGNLKECIRTYETIWANFDDIRGLVERKRPNIMTLVSATASSSKSSVEFCESKIEKQFPCLQEKNTLLKKYYEILDVLGDIESDSRSETYSSSGHNHPSGCIGKT